MELELEGFSFDYTTDVNPSLECAICRSPFVVPAMSPTCQHIFCNLCITRAIDLSPTCPIDRSPLALSDLVEAPRIIQQMVEELRVACPNRERGCKVDCERGLMRGHLREECEFRAGGSTGGKGKGKEEDGRVGCEVCGELVPSSQVEEHPSTCPSAPTTCSHCATPLLRHLLPSHLLLCPSIHIPCPHTTHGCTARLPRSQMTEDHLEVSCAYEPMKEFLDRYEVRMGEVEGENGVLRRRCERLEEGMREMREVLEGVRGGMGEFWVPPLQDERQSRRLESKELEELDIQGFFDTTTLQDALPPLSSHPPTSPLLPSSRSPILLPSHLHPSPSLPTFPWPQPSFLPSQHPSPPSLPTVLSDLSTSITTLSTSLASLEARQSSALMSETLRIQDDVQSLRSVLHGMRMQMHHLLMEVGRTNGVLPGPSRRTGAEGSGDSAGSEGSDDEGGLRFRRPMMYQVPMMGSVQMPPPPPRMGMGGMHQGISPPFPMYAMGGTMKL